MKIAVVLGSTRKGRLGERVAKWVMKITQGIEGAEFVLLDLADYELPFFDETIAPLNRDDSSGKRAEGVQRWIDDVAAADGYLFITTEYNYKPPAVLENALDFLGMEAAKKPAAVLSYSDSAMGGIIANNQLRLLLGKLFMLPVPVGVPLAKANEILTKDGVMKTSDMRAKYERYLAYSLGELVNYTKALIPVRSNV